jgi:hypothetical protein
MQNEEIGCAADFDLAGAQCDFRYACQQKASL